MTRRIMTLILSAVLLAGILAPAALAEEAGTVREYYVYTENHKPLMVRSEPKGEVIGALEYGARVQVLSMVRDAWAEISFPHTGAEEGSGSAYVNRRYLIDIPPEELTRAMESEAEAYTGDPLTDINAEFASATEVEPYRITIRPARVTSWVNMRWIPSETGMIVARYAATEELTVLKEMDHYLQVQDPDTGDVGYIHKRFAVK